MYSIGFDIGGSHITCGLFGECYSLIGKQTMPFSKMPPVLVAKQMVDVARTVCSTEGVPFDDVESVGVCIPGSIDAVSGIVIDAHNLGFHNVPLKKILENESGKSVQLKNDADSATLAEQRFGALKGVRNGMLLTIGTGIGGGVIIDSKLYSGGNGNGVELGHIQMDIHGSKCTCGRIGCIETLCSAAYLNRKAYTLCEMGNKAISDYSEKNASHPDAKALIECAKNGDSDCLCEFNQYIEYLSDALATYINILDPMVIAIGGGISEAGSFLIDPVSKLANKKCFFKRSADIVLAKFGNLAGLIGSVIY